LRSGPGAVAPTIAEARSILSSGLFRQLIETRAEALPAGEARVRVPRPPPRLAAHSVREHLLRRAGVPVRGREGKSLSWICTVRAVRPWPTALAVQHLKSSAYRGLAPRLETSTSSVVRPRRRTNGGRPRQYRHAISRLSRKIRRGGVRGCLRRMAAVRLRAGLVRLVRLLWRRSRPGTRDESPRSWLLALRRRARALVHKPSVLRTVPAL